MLAKWHRWIDIYWIEDARDNYKWCGVYVIRLADSSGHPIEIGRFLGSNSSGIIQIGHSNNVGNRLCQFYKASLKGKVAHSEGQRLFLIRMVTQFQKKTYKGSKLQFAVKQHGSKEEAREEEERLLKCYFLKFGELPPLNYVVADYTFSWIKPNCGDIDLW